MPTSRPTARPYSSDASRPYSSDTSRTTAPSHTPRTSSAGSGRNPGVTTPRTPTDSAGPSTRRGRNAARANTKRTEQSRAFANGTRSDRPSSRSPQTPTKGVDLFASFDTGLAPNLDASFEELGVPAVLVKALNHAGIDRPFPIQAATMADCLAGRDVLGRGRTGSGKTLAFVLPLLTRLAATPKPREAGRPRALILVPTRELAIQIQTAMDPLAKLLSLRTATIFGGVGPVPQINALRQGVEIIIACPGRLDDHIMSKHARLDSIEIAVLDEADHMADMGFLPVVKKLLDQTPQDTQHLLFSATLDNGIDTLVNRYLHNPVLRSVDPVESVEVKMTHHVFAVGAEDRFPVLRDLAAAPGRIIVFTRTKHGAKKLTKALITSGVPTVELQGNLSQNVRTRNLEMFRSGEASALVATDIAARGIHIDEVALVVHFDPPVDHKAYLHRSGRTARAGAEGTVITMMLDSQVSEVRDLTRKAGISPTVTTVAPSHALLQEVAPGDRMFVEPGAGPVDPPKRPSNNAHPRTNTRDSTSRPANGGARSGRTGQPARSANPPRPGQPARSGPASGATAGQSARRGGPTGRVDRRDAPGASSRNPGRSR